MKFLATGKWARIRLSFFISILLFILGYFFVHPRFVASQADLREGDLVFQALPDQIDLVRAIEGISGAPYSHCGIVVKHEGKLQILEALGTVSYADIPNWIMRGRGNKMAVYRFKEKYRSSIPHLVANAKTYFGLAYDSRYEFSKDDIYCSELIFHSWFSIYQRDLGLVQKLGDLKWQGYEETIYKYDNSTSVPMERRMITPIELARAPELEKVYDNGVENEKKY